MTDVRGNDRLVGIAEDRPIVVESDRGVIGNMLTTSPKDRDIPPGRTTSVYPNASAIGQAAKRARSVSTRRLRLAGLMPSKILGCWTDPVADCALWHRFLKFGHCGLGNW